MSADDVRKYTAPDSVGAGDYAWTRLDSFDLASIGSRFWASLIDSIILAIFAAITTSLARPDASGAWFWDLLSWLVPAAYFIWPYSTNGQTPGKSFLHIRVATIDGSPLNWRKGILRYLGTFISGLPLGLGYFWALFDADNQAWHDKLAGTIVVHDSSDPLLARLPRDAARRRQRRWLLVLAVPLLAVIIIGAIWSLSTVVLGGTQEVAEIGAFPDARHSGEEILPGDLTSIGLGPATFFDAREVENIWEDLSFSRGTFAQYEAGRTPAVWIAALKYRNESAANDEFETFSIWAEDCGAYVVWTVEETSYVSCRFTNEYHKIYQNGVWIVHILVAESAPSPPSEYVDRVRDALVDHWGRLQ